MFELPVCPLEFASDLPLELLRPPRRPCCLLVAVFVSIDVVDSESWHHAHSCTCGVACTRMRTQVLCFTGQSTMELTLAFSLVLDKVLRVALKRQSRMQPITALSIMALCWV